MEKLTILNAQPGIQKDGTQLDSRSWIDGQHCRFQRGKPRKMGGYQELIGTLNNVPRGTYLVPSTPNFNYYVADSDSIGYFIFNSQYVNLSGNVLIDRTPETFVEDQNNDFFFDSMYSDTDKGGVLLAFAGPNLQSIDNTVERDIFFGELNPVVADEKLVSTGNSTSGGIVVLHPYLFIFGNDGHIRWTARNNPQIIAGDVRAAATKVVAGIATRGGNSSPAGIFFSLNSVIRCTFVGEPLQFSFDTVSDETSILSSKSVIEYDGMIFWVGVDKFYSYNGTVRSIPNNMVSNWFFENLNYSQAQKVWATKVPRFNEIWFSFPFGGSLEANAAVVFNIELNIWYPTMLNRSAGTFPQIFPKPIWAENIVNEDGNYSVWVHEVGYNRNRQGAQTSIDSYVETPIISLAAFGPDGSFNGINRWIEFIQFEPDMIQVGDMTMTIRGRKYARSPVVDLQVINITPTTGRIDILKQAREMTVVFRSNTLDGYYEMGNHLCLFKLGDGRE